MEAKQEREENEAKNEKKRKKKRKMTMKRMWRETKEEEKQDEPALPSRVTPMMLLQLQWAAWWAVERRAWARTRG